MNHMLGKMLGVATVVLGLLSPVWGTVVECSTWAQVKENLEAGTSVKLTSNVSQGAEQSQLKLTTAGMNVTLDLNGYTVTCYSLNSRLADVYVQSGAGATFTLKDSVGTGVVKDGSWTNGGCVWIGPGNFFVMESGKIDNCHGSGYSGAVYVNQGSFTMNGGSIMNCSTSNKGGAVFVSSDGTFTMNGGSIMNCSTSTEGGAVFVSIDGTFTMNGGTITNCSASNEGGAICCCGGYVALRNGTISGCTAGNGCGAVYFDYAQSLVPIEKMTFTGNKAKNGYGGAINFGNDGSACSYELRNCTFTDNSATKSGGAFSIGKGCKVSIYDCTITGNTSGSGYGAIHLNGENGNSANVYGAVVSGNSPNGFNIEKANAFTVYGGVYGCNPSGIGNLAIASGSAVTQVGSKWVVGRSVAYDSNNRLVGGTYTFCPTNAAYVAGGVEVKKAVATVENATEPKTWTLFDTESEVLAVPAPVAHATAVVYTNGVLSAENAVGSGQWYVWFNKEATVVYTADGGYCFEGGATVVTNALNTMVSPAVNVGNPPKAIEAIVVAYVDEWGEKRTACAHNVVGSGSRVTWTAGWHVVTNAVTITGGADCQGAVMLILVDGAKLTIEGVGHENPGIGVTGESSSFVVYGQTGGTGALQVTGGKYAAGIGGSGGAGGSSITINGGTVTAYGGFCGAGIGGGTDGGGSSITINGGTVTAYGGESGAGIGGGFEGGGSSITINGGTVTAYGGNQGAGIGGGYEGSGSDITINGGKVTATGGLSGASIGGGTSGTGSNIKINGGMVTANGGRYADCIGRGRMGENASAIYVADGILFKAGDSENPTTVIPHASLTTDIASLIRGKQYATAYPRRQIQAKPTPVVHATAAVYTNGFLSAEIEVGFGAWYAWSNETAMVVYRAEAGYCFEGGATVVTNKLDTTVDPAKNLGTPPAVATALVSYLDENGRMQTANATVVVASGSRVMWSVGWYVVTNDVTITGGADCSGAVNLILADGAKLTISGVADYKAGIAVSGDGNSFAIYGQANGTGWLNVTGGYAAAGIGGGDYGEGSNITINGGTVTAIGGDMAAGIGGGSSGNGSKITINGGTVTATGGGEGGDDGGAGIGGGDEGAGSEITISGGVVTATGDEDAAGIGSGKDGSSSKNIYVADEIILKAGASDAQLELISHASSTTDVASSLADKRCASAETIIIYPGYLNGKSEAVKAKFKTWAKKFGSYDPDGVYTNAFLLNVATNNQTAAEKAFAIGSIVVTNGIVDIQLPQPLAPSTVFNGDLWLSCTTNFPAEWHDVENGRYIDEKGAFLRCLIDFDHTLTPESFPTEPTGTKTIKVLAR